MTLYFKSPAIMRVWQEAMEAASSAAVNAVSRCTPRPGRRSVGTADRDVAGDSATTTAPSNMHKGRTSYRAWANAEESHVSISLLPSLDVSQSMSNLNRTRQSLRQKSREISSRRGTFLQRLEAQSHVFGAEVSWRRLKLVDPTEPIGSPAGSSSSSKKINPDGSTTTFGDDLQKSNTRHGFDPVHHTRASAKERRDVAEDESFFASLKYHPRLRELALGDDSPQFQKQVAALYEQVRGVKHNSQKLLASSTAYFAAGEAFCAAGHAFAQDMIKYAPYQRAEWNLWKGVLTSNKSTVGGTGLNAKNEEKLSKDLGEDTVRTRKLAIVTEELTLLIRESIIHLEVGLAQQHEALIKPLEHLVQVESKSCKLSVERYEREKKLYLAALSKFQGLKVKESKKGVAKKDAMQQEAAQHAKIFEDARFEAALRLGQFDAVRDTRYLEQLTQVRTLVVVLRPTPPSHFPQFHVTVP